MVRIPFPPAVSRQTIGSSAARQPAPEGELLTIKKAAVVLGVAPSTIHRLLNDGIIAGEQPTPAAPWRIAVNGSRKKPEPKKLPVIAAATTAIHAR